MKKNLRTLRFGFALLAAATISAGITGEASKHVRVPMVTDWTSRHVVFSAPRTAEQAMRVQGDPRYRQQWLRRNVHTTLPIAANDDNSLPADPSFFRIYGGGGGNRGPGSGRTNKRGPAFRGDWSVNIGSGASMENNSFPAKFAFDITTASCANDYVAFTTDLPGAGTDVANIVAFNNLYSGPSGICGTGAPSNLFAYHTQSNGGVSNTSPVLSGGVSGDGSQIAFIEGGAGHAAVLHILRWVAGEGTPGDTGMAVAPHIVTTDAPTYVACLSGATSCLLNLTFGNLDADTNSAPFVNYDTDALYVGDDDGVLHKFAGVFEGTPAEVTTGGWPITVSGAELNSPIYELHSNNLYVTDSAGILSFVREADSSVGACASGAPPCLGAVTIDATGGHGPIDDAPIVDTTNETVFVFVHEDSTAITSSVIQVTTALASEVTATVGTTFNVPLYSGDFDNNYFNGADPSTGFLYVCGNEGSGSGGGLTQNSAIYRIGFDAAGTMNSANDGNRLDISSGQDVGTGATPTTCSPGTEIDNGTTDLIFFSVHTGGLATNCADEGCVMSYNITSSFPTAAANSAQENSGTSGIIIDNIFSNAQTSSIYFTTGEDATCSTGGNGGCATKLTQGALN